MEHAERPATSESSSLQSNALTGFRQLKVAIVAGLVGQILIWGSAIALWVVGSVYSSIPISKKIAYGANGFSVSAGEIFVLNSLLIVGATVALLSLVLTTRGLQKVAKAPPSFSVDAVVSLTTLGTIGFGMFAVGWALWLGSFVAPGASADGNPLAYTPVLAPNIADVVNLLLIVGGLLAFLGMLGIAWGSSKIGTTYEDGAVELGGALSILPVFSIIGHLLFLVGLARGERKLHRGWAPPSPPPPPPTYPHVLYPGEYPGGVPIVVPSQQGSWDSLAAVLVASLVLLWIFLLPFTLFLSSGGLTYGPGNTPAGGNNAGPSMASSGFSPVFPVLLVALVATAIVLPLAIVRNRRKRQRLAAQAVRPPPPPSPPSPPPPPAREDDPLDHLV